MDRFTEWRDGHGSLIRGDGYTKLARYEDTGLEPEEILALLEMLPANGPKEPNQINTQGETDTMKMKIKLDEGAFMPVRAHDTDAGMDLMAMEDQIVPAHGSATFDTGVHVELPTFRFVGDIEMDNSGRINTVFVERTPTVGFLKSKSGLNVKHHITSDGVIDVGYTGSICVKLYNHGDSDYKVLRGDKISQLVILPVLTPELEQVDDLKPTERGTGGFGSTGR